MVQIGNIDVRYKGKRTLRLLKNVVEKREGGIYKRIDENRELLELLQSKVPDFLETHHWVEGWLMAQDRFLCDVLKELPVNSSVISDRFPRPWPTKDSEAEKTRDYKMSRRRDSIR